MIVNHSGSYTGYIHVQCLLTLNSMESVMHGQCYELHIVHKWWHVSFTVHCTHQNGHGWILTIIAQSLTNQPTNQPTNQFNTLLEKPYWFTNDLLLICCHSNLISYDTSLHFITIIVLFHLGYKILLFNMLICFYAHFK